MAFVVKQRLSLDFIGPDWKDGYIEYQPLTYADSEKLDGIRKSIGDSDKLNVLALNLVKEKLVGGMGHDGEKLVEITKDNVQELPIFVLTKLIEALTAGAGDDAKKKNVSGI